MLYQIQIKERSTNLPTGVGKHTVLLPTPVGKKEK